MAPCPPSTMAAVLDLKQKRPCHYKHGSIYISPVTAEADCDDCDSSQPCPPVLPNNRDRLYEGYNPHAYIPPEPVGLYEYPYPPERESVKRPQAVKGPKNRKPECGNRQRPLIVSPRKRTFVGYQPVMYSFRLLHHNEQWNDDTTVPYQQCPLWHCRPNRLRSDADRPW